MIFKPKCPECGSTEDFGAVADFEGEVWADASANDDGELKQDGEFSHNDCSFSCFNIRFECRKCQAQFAEPDKEPDDEEARQKVRHDQAEQQGQMNLFKE